MNDRFGSQADLFTIIAECLLPGVKQTFSRDENDKEFRSPLECLLSPIADVQIVGNRGNRGTANGHKRTFASKEKPRRSGVSHHSMSTAKQVASPRYGVTSSTQSSMALMLQPCVVWPSPSPCISIICSPRANRYAVSCPVVLPNRPASSDRPVCK